MAWYSSRSMPSQVNPLLHHLLYFHQSLGSIGTLSLSKIFPKTTLLLLSVYLWDDTPCVSRLIAVDVHWPQSPVSSPEQRRKRETEGGHALVKIRFTLRNAPVKIQVNTPYTLWRWTCTGKNKAYALKCTGKKCLQVHFRLWTKNLGYTFPTYSEGGHALVKIKFTLLKCTGKNTGIHAPLALTDKGTLIRAGIFKKSMGARNRAVTGLSYRPARLHRLAEFIPWSQFLGSINV